MSCLRNVKGSDGYFLGFLILVSQVRFLSGSPINKINGLHRVRCGPFFVASGDMPTGNANLGGVRFWFEVGP